MKKRGDCAILSVTNTREGDGMELHQKLQELRKQRGMTQQELADRLYVSRTAVSKWESGRGYPAIDSIKALASFFSVSVDSLLSSEEALSVGRQEKRVGIARLHDLVFGLLDLSVALLLFLPLFAERSEGGVGCASLLALSDAPPYLLVPYCALVLFSILSGILQLSLQGAPANALRIPRRALSLSVGAVLSLVLILSLQPYAAVFTIAPLAVKLTLLAKRP